MDFLTELLNVKSENDCEDIVAVDAYSDSEIALGWLNCLSEVLEDIKTVKILGQDIKLDGFDLECENAVIAVCKLGKKKVRVSLSSV